MSYADDLVAVALPYWEAEAEIAKRFFASSPSREDHVFWLRAQIWKELHPVDGYFNGLHRELTNLAEAFPRVDKDVDRHHFAFLLRQMLEEFNHYVLFADILEFLTGKKTVEGDYVQLPEEKKLQEVRHRYTTGGSAIDKAAVLFTEGGGARLFREGAKLAGGELERMIAHAMQVIYDDEHDHFIEAAKEAESLIASPADAERMKTAIVDVSRQRVAMRNEMFHEPMTQAQVDEFIANFNANA